MAEEGTPLQWVERLLEPSVEDTMMIQAAQVFSQSHYCDVVEERNIGHLCGYPLCGSPLGKQSQQKYHISLAQKKVFDLTERKKFCSSECYRASNYYASQLSSLPLAVREGRSVDIKLFPCASGESKKETAIAPTVSVEVAVTGAMKKDITIVARESPTVSEAADKMGVLDLNNDDGDDGTHTLSFEPKHPKLSSVSRLLHAMSSWCSPDTRQLLTSVRQQSDTERCSIQQVEQRTTSCTTAAGCTPAGLREDKELVCEQETAAEWSRTQCHSTERKRTECEPGSTEGERAGGESGDAESVVLPPVHTSAQSQLQMGIFTQQLKRNFPNVTTQLSLNLHELLPWVISLVRTFRLSRHTITFKPAEWEVIIFVLLRIVNPKWVLSPGQTAVIQKWLEGISVSENDLKLMLEIFQV